MQNKSNEPVFKCRQKVKSKLSRVGATDASTLDEKQGYWLGMIFF